MGEHLPTIHKLDLQQFVRLQVYTGRPSPKQHSSGYLPVEDMLFISVVMDCKRSSGPIFNSSLVKLSIPAPLLDFKDLIAFFTSVRKSDGLKGFGSAILSVISFFCNISLKNLVNSSFIIEVDLQPLQHCLMMQ